MLSSVSLNKIKQIEVTDVSTGEEVKKTLTVSKMPLERYAQFWAELAKIPKTISVIVKMFFKDEKVSKEDLKKAAEERGDEEHAAEIELAEDITYDQIIEAVFALPNVLVEHWNDLVTLLAIATGIDVEEVKKLDLDEATLLIMAVVEVNNFFGIGNRYREALGRKKAAQQVMTVPNKKRR